ncbi:MULTISPECIES: hypothetical protein [Mycobacteriales]|uniref:hypothetical protein n=1 Tax=unclassified Nocardia TaxID=2637762 RepID=UPI0033A82A22
MTDTRPSPLATVLRVDGWSTALFGVALTVSAPLLRAPLGLPTPLSLLFGVVMVAGGAALLAIARRGPHRYARPVVAVNAASALGMTALACSGLLPLTGLGIGFLLAGAALVATYAALELRAAALAEPVTVC